MGQLSNVSWIVKAVDWPLLQPGQFNVHSILSRTMHTHAYTCSYIHLYNLQPQRVNLNACNKRSTVASDESAK